MTDTNSVIRFAAVRLGWSREKLPPAMPCVTLGSRPLETLLNAPPRQPPGVAVCQEVRGNNRDRDGEQQLSKR